MFGIQVLQSIASNMSLFRSTISTGKNKTWIFDETRKLENDQLSLLLFFVKIVNLNSQGFEIQVVDQGT